MKSTLSMPWDSMFEFSPGPMTFISTGVKLWFFWVSTPISALHLANWTGESHLTQGRSDSLSLGTLELGLRNSFWTQFTCAKLGVWGSLILPCYGEQSGEREKLGKHIKGKNSEGFLVCSSRRFQKPGHVPACRFHVHCSVFVTASSLSAYGLWGDTLHAAKDSFCMRHGTHQH